MPFEEGSVNLLSLLVILTNVFAYLLIIFLLLDRSEGRIGKWLISLVILQYSLWVFPEFLHLFGLLDNFPHAVRIFVVGSFLLGPLTYFYVKFCTEKDFRLKPKMYWHFLPAIIDLFFQMPFYTLNGDEKLNYFYNFFAENSFQQPLWLTLIKCIQILFYMGVCLYLIRVYKLHLKDNASSIDPALHRLLIFFSGALCIPFLSGFIISFVSADYSLYITFFAFFIVILTAFSLLVLKPRFFVPFPHQLVQQSSESSNSKYEKSSLTVVQKESYLKVLQDYITAKKPYLDSELTLAKLSEQVDIPPHHLSQVINERLGINFLDLINQYRVEDVKAQLLDPEKNMLTIIAIGFDAGFKSKSSFYTAFKKHTGRTPSAYRENEGSLVY